jgi:hypothetical protein
MILTGTGAGLDIKIGASVTKSIILHFTLASKSMPGPAIENNGSVEFASDDLSVNELIYGVGATYYFMPNNLFASGSAGLGQFRITDDSNNTITDTNIGFSFQVMIGKEWWVSKKWGLGFGIAYNKTLVRHVLYGQVNRLNSNRFSVMFSATFD